MNMWFPPHIHARIWASPQPFIFTICFFIALLFSSYLNDHLFEAAPDQMVSRWLACQHSHCMIHLLISVLEGERSAFHCFGAHILGIFVCSLLDLPTTIFIAFPSLKSCIAFHFQNSMSTILAQVKRITANNNCVRVVFPSMNKSELKARNLLRD